MNSNLIIFQIFIIFCSLNTYIFQAQDFPINLNISNSYYYDEKYFRLLTNNYDEIEQGKFWSSFTSEGIGFTTQNNFGSIILLKDWSMYNFKLTKIIFKKNCTFNYQFENETNFNCSAEMWLYHTKDNQYYPPGRRIYMKENIFIIVIPFVSSDNNNPANDQILDYFNLEEYIEYKSIKATVKKPIKLHHIIQNQPSLLFEGKYKDTDTLFMIFTQYHFISKKNFDYLSEMNDINITMTEISDTIYRNVRKLEEIKPKATLMAYSKGNYLKNFLFFIFLFLF